MFGSALLVAPLFEAGDSRKVYLPPGTWIDYQTGKVYPGGQWHQIAAGQSIFRVRVIKVKTRIEGGKFMKIPANGGEERHEPPLNGSWPIEFPAAAAF